MTGFYEQQDPQQPEYNNRGLFSSDAEGKYSVRCLVPTPYPIPFDSGAGDILKLLDRSPMRPAHIHFLIKAKGYKTLITQVSSSGGRLQFIITIYSSQNRSLTEIASTSTRMPFLLQRIISSWTLLQPRILNLKQTRSLSMILFSSQKANRFHLSLFLISACISTHTRLLRWQKFQS